MVEVGTWVFTVGLLIAVVLGFFSVTLNPVILTVLIVLGLIVGFLNITEKEVHGFLLSSIALLLVGSVTFVRIIPYIGVQLQGALNYTVLFIAPAALVVAIKEVFLLASKK